ncbi:unnamed protein product [Microthlaspi erraticum]|uniref:Uncharacterized protein n=1 Tax=Microthlaspi erraticum TaxID=1685480 RepID=A0A6D2HQA1_9BRAS|nr:unnamed protein product [Microthlaspi erraticum]
MDSSLYAVEEEHDTMSTLYPDDEPETFITFEPIYRDNQHTADDYDKNLRRNPKFLFDFEVLYTRVPEPDSDGDDDLDFGYLEERTVHQTREFDKDWLIGGDRDQIQDTVCQILDMIQVPAYRDIVHTLTLDILDLKKLEALSDSPEVERVRVDIEVIVRRFPDVAVAPKSDEAVEKQLQPERTRNRIINTVLYIFNLI